MIIALALLLFVTSLVPALLSLVSAVPYFYSALCTLLFWYALLPNRLAPVGVAATLFVLALALFANNFKVAALSLPITYFDSEACVVGPTSIG